MKSVSTTLALAALCSGCATISGNLPVVESAPPSGTFRAGAARTDLTPPPGFAMGGHSIAGQVSRGHWLRLYARAIYLETPDGGNLALVSTDLWSVSAGLGDRVAEILSTKQAECHIARDRLILAATHTHQSPGNFSSSEMYNTLASARPGFDRDLFEFIATRISDAIVQSCIAAKPAIMRFAGTRVPGLARNRSLEGFVENPESDDVMRANADLPGSCVNDVTTDERACLAVDPSLKVIWISSAEDPRHTIAVAAFVAVHPTTMSHRLTLYSSDFFGAASIRAERLLRSAPAAPPVVAFFNGPEGDVSPAWEKQDFKDLVRLSDALGSQIAGLAGQGTVLTGELRHRFALKTIAGECLSGFGPTERCAPGRPSGGPAALGGAEDGRTFLYDWGCKEGVGAAPTAGNPHPTKPGPLCLFAYSIARLGLLIFDGPKSAPMGVYRLGPVVLVTLPGEFTTVMGQRIRQSIQSESRGSILDVILIGLANEYLSYFTTPEEFATQQYEGASTLYGADSGLLVGEHARKLVVELDSSAPLPSPTGLYSYPAGLSMSFSPRQLGPLSEDRLEADLRHVLFADSKRAASWQRFCWTGPAPAMSDRSTTTWTATSHVRIEREVSPGNWQPLVLAGHQEDDEGANFLTALATWNGTQSSWCTFWLTPQSAPAGPLRFAVQTHDGSFRHSSPLH